MDGTREFIALNGDNNRFDGGPAFWAPLNGDNWAIRVKLRVASFETRVNLFDAGNASNVNRFYLYIDTDGDIVIAVNDTSQTFGSQAYPIDGDWHTIHFVNTADAVNCYLDGVLVNTGGAWNPPTLNASDHVKSNFFATFFDLAHCGADIESFEVWTTPETHDSVAAADFLDLRTDWPGAAVLVDNSGTHAPFTVNAMNTETFYDHERTRITGRKKVFTFLSCGNIPGSPLNWNNFQPDTGWLSLWNNFQQHVDDGADGVYNHLPFSRDNAEVSVISGDAAHDIFRFKADGSLTYDMSVVNPINWTRYASDFLARNPDKQLVSYWGGPTRDGTLTPYYRRRPGYWLSRMMFEAQYIMGVTSGSRWRNRKRHHVHVDLTGAAKGSRADLETRNLAYAWFQLYGNSGHPIAVEPAPDESARHLFNFDNISLHTQWDNVLAHQGEYTQNNWVIGESGAGAEAKIDELAADPNVTHLIVHPPNLAYALTAVGA